MTLGQSSKVISLPKKWLNINKLQKGNNVILTIQSDGTLLVSPNGDFDEEIKKISIEIKPNETEGSIIRKIIGAYMNGFTLIVLTSTNIFTVTQQQIIRDIIRKLYMMIISSETSRIELETLVDETKVSIPASVDRMHMITFAMFRDVIQALKRENRDLALSVISLEEDVDQMMYLILRILRIAVSNPLLAHQLELDALDSLDYQTLVYRIERIADHIASIAECIITVIDSGAKIPRNMKEVLINASEIVFENYEKTIDSFKHMDIVPTNMIIDAQERISELYSDITPLPVIDKIIDSTILSEIVSIRENIKSISNISADIAELTIDRAYTKNI
jgi:phosphate uptake regulator